MADEDTLEKLRRLCLALPETTERISHGEPTWFVRGKKTFVMYANHHHDDRLAFWCAAPDGAQEALLAANPERFFVPPYVGHRGWLGVRLDVPVDWDEIAELVVAAYRVVAPKRLLAELALFLLLLLLALPGLGQAAGPAAPDLGPAARRCPLVAFYAA